MSDKQTSIELIIQADRTMNKANHKQNAAQARKQINELASSYAFSTCLMTKHNITSLIDELEQNARMGSASFITAPKVERIVEALNRLQQP